MGNQTRIPDASERGKGHHQGLPPKRDYLKIEKNNPRKSRLGNLADNHLFRSIS